MTAIPHILAAVVDLPQPRAEGATDVRFYLYLGLTLVFVCLVGYLVVTHGRTRRAMEDCQRLENRIAELEGGGHGRGEAR